MRSDALLPSAKSCSANHEINNMFVFNGVLAESLASADCVEMLRRKASSATLPLHLLQFGIQIIAEHLRVILQAGAGFQKGVRREIWGTEVPQWGTPSRG